MLVAVTVVGQAVFNGGRVLLSYRVLGFGGDAVTVGVFTAAFSLVPLLIALRAGRLVDDGHAPAVMRAGLIATVAATVCHDGSISLTFFSLEPQFHGVVHRRIDYARAARRYVEVSSAVEANSATFGHHPSAAVHLEVGTVSLVGEYFAACFAHWVVSQEVAFRA